ncbi:hypothetical protein CBS9595_004003 [Malassezia furfur]|nr:hypothetical protein CBS9595_004003 [Malassezia furfur]
MGSLGVALRRGIDDTAARLAPHALRWLWLYTLELPPMLFARRAACERRAPRRSAVPPIAAAPGVLRTDAWRVAPGAHTEQRRGAQSAATTSAARAPPADASASAPLCAHTPFEDTRAEVLDALDALHDAPPTVVRRTIPRILATLADLPRNAPDACLAALRHDAGVRIAALAERHAACAAFAAEAAVLRGELDEALTALGALLATHTPQLEHVQHLHEAGHVRRMRSDPVLRDVYRACKAVLGEAQRRVLAEQRARNADAPTARAVSTWLWAHPLMMALAQPVFPKVCQAIYSVLAALRNPVAHVAALRASLAPERAARAAALVAVALANRGAAEVGARIVLASEADGVPLPERAVRRVLRVLIDAHGRRIVIASLIALLDARGVAQCAPPTHRLLALYYAEQGDAARAEAREARLAAAGADVAQLQQHVALLLAAHAGDVERIAQLYGAVYARTLADAMADRGAREVGLYVYHQLRAHAQRGDLRGAHALFGAYAAHRRVSESMCHVLLALSRQHGHADAALHLVAEMDAAQVRVSSSTLAQLVRALGAAHLPERAASVVQWYATRGVRIDRRVYVALLNAYVEAGHWSAVFGIFRWMQAQVDPALRPDAAAYTTMLKAHILHGTPVHQVLRLLHTMRTHGFVPDERAYALVLQSACDARQLALAESLFALLDSALQATHGGATRHHYTILLHALLQAGELRTAQHYLGQMRAAGLAPSHVTYGVLIKAYAAAGEDVAAVAHDLALQLTDEAAHAQQGAADEAPVRGDGPPFEDLLVPLIHTHGRRGELAVAEQLFARLRDALAPEPPSIRAWTTLLNAYRYANDARGVLRVWDELYLHVLERAAPSGEPRMGAHQKGMLSVPLSVVISALSDAGHFRKIAAVWARVKKDGFAFDAQNFNHLAVALARVGRVREALQLIEHVLPHRPPALEAAVHAAPPPDAEADEARYARNPLYQPRVPPAEGPWEPRTLAPRRKTDPAQAPAPHTPPAPVDVGEARHALFDDVDSADTDDMDLAPWLDRALLVPPSVWYASYDTLREVCAAIDQQGGTLRRKRAARPGAHAEGASALASPQHAPESVAEALHAFPVAAMRVAEYEHRAALFDAPDP